MVEHHVARPVSPLDPESVRSVLRPDIGGVDCRNWSPVFYEGVRELLRAVRDRKKQLVLFEIPEPLALQLSLLGVPVSEGRAVIQAESGPLIGHCPSCGGMLRLPGEGQFECGHCRARLLFQDGSILA